MNGSRLLWDYSRQLGDPGSSPVLPKSEPVLVMVLLKWPVLVLPVDDASFFSSISFHWLTKYLWRAYRGNFQEASLPPADSCHINSERLSKLLSDLKIKTGLQHGSMNLLVWRFVRTRLIIASLLHMASVLIAIISPFMVVNNFLELSNPSWGERFTWGGILVGFEMLATLVKAWSHSISNRTATRLRSAFFSVSYKKLIRVADPGPSGPSPQKLLSDAAALHSAVLYGAHVISAPLIMAACVTVMWPGHRLTLFVVTATIVTLLLLWVLVTLSSYLASRVISISALRTARLQELMDMFIVMKMTVIDNIFTSAITGYHVRELSYMVKSMFCDAVSESVLQALPLIASMLLFCRIRDIDLTVNLLVIVLLYTHVKDSMFRFWHGLRSLSDASTALCCFKELLLLDEGESFVLLQNSTIVKTQAVNVAYANFEYRNKKKPAKPAVQRFSRSKFIDMTMAPPPALADIMLEIPKGMIMGVVGSGKSDLLLAILGQLQTTKGSSLRDGTCAYVCGNKPWLIESCDVRENILFLGRSEDDTRKQPSRAEQNSRYYNTMVMCGLGRDIDALPLQEKTIVADLSLTPSQMQRISLARAVYADKDIYLLDEPLNAVSPKQCEDIFKRAATGLLKDKTIIIATHYTQFLNQCHHVVELQDRHIVAQGTHDELLRKRASYAELINKPHFVEAEDVPFADIRPSGSKDTLLEPQPQEGTYWALGWLTVTSVALVLSVIVLFSSLVLLIYILVTFKSQQHVGDELSWFTHKKYASIVGTAAILFGILWRFLFAQTVKRVSHRLHSDWLQKLVRAPVGCLSTGRVKQDVLHCFSLHTQLICQGLPLVVERCLENVLLILGCGGVLLFKGPWSLVPFAVLHASCFVFINIYRAAYLQFSEMVTLKEQPLEEFIRTSIQGRMTIQSLERNKTFISEFTSLCDAHASYVYLLNAASHWVSLRIQLLSVLFVGGVLVAVGNDPFMDTGLPMCLLVSWQLGGFTRRTVRMAVASESGVHALKNSSKLVHALDEELWSSNHSAIGINHGGVAFDDIHVRPMLHAATFNVDTGKHVGVYGSGRLSVVATLFKLVRPSRGEIKLGGVATSVLCPNTVRWHLSLVPRGSPLPSTDVRSLLDARGDYTDSDLWAAVRRVELDSRVKKLDMRLRRGGEGWTSAERETLWLAKAVVEDAQIVVLEECEHLTAEKVRKHLPNCTILTVTGRLMPNSKLKYDLVITIADGKVQVGDAVSMYAPSDSGLSQASSTSTVSMLETSI